MSESKTSLATKLAEVMGEIDHVEKKGKNQFHNYSYVKAADLANIVRKKLAAKNVVMLSDVVEVRHCEIVDRKQNPMYGVDMKVKYTFYDGDSDATLSFHGYGSGLDAGDKGSYKAHTGALKYALRNAFLVPDEKSDPEQDSKVDSRMEGDGEEEDVPPPKRIVTGTITDVQTTPKGTFYKLKQGEEENICTTVNPAFVKQLAGAHGSYVEFAVHSKDVGKAKLIVNIETIGDAA